MSWLDFIIIGTQKGGTTSLSVNLSKHPEIAMDERHDPLDSEVHFFDRDQFFDGTTPRKIGEVPVKEINYFFGSCNLPRGTIHRLRTIYINESTLFLYKCRIFFSLNKTTDKPLDNILRMTRLCGDILVGEKTPYLMVNRVFLERIHNSFPHVKLIVSLRDPIRRAYSHWQMMCEKGKEKKTFDRCVREEITRLTGSEPVKEDRLYIRRGLYAEQLKEIYKLFDIQQVHVMRLEHVIQDPTREYSNLFHFLGVDTVPIHIEHIHETKIDKCNEPISDELMMYMKEFYDTYNGTYTLPMNLHPNHLQMPNQKGKSVQKKSRRRRRSL